MVSTSATAGSLGLSPRSPSLPFLPPGAREASGSEIVVLGPYPHRREPSCSSANCLWKSKDSAPNYVVIWKQIFRLSQKQRQRIVERGDYADDSMNK